MKKVLLLLALIITAYSTHAQSCTQKLVQAERDYEGGRLANIPDLIGECFRNEKGGGFSKEERIRAHRLLTLVYIFTDNEPAADKSLINLLKADPEHLLDERVDPAELVILYKKFQTKPIFRIGFRAGANGSFINVLDRFTTANANATVENKFYNGTGEGDGTAGIGFWGELTYERHLRKGFEIVGGLQIRRSKYDVDSFGNDRQNFNSTVRNAQTYLRLPVYLRFTHRYNRRNGVKPYAILGASVDYLVSAKYTEASRRGGTPFTLSGNDDLKAFDQVNDINYSLTAGLGVKLPVKTHFLTFEVRYDKSLLNYINAENRFANQSIAFDLAHVEDNLTLDFLSISAGYTLSIYHPKRLSSK